MRNFLSHQVVAKKISIQDEKKIESEQVKMWNDDNEQYFRKEKNTNERVILFFNYLQIKQLNSSYADYLKSQMESKKNLSKNEKMNEEEYRMNKELLEESYMPNASKRNFLI